MLSESQSHYDVLEISPDASQHEIRAAYLRLKSAYSRDSAALYSLFSKEETQAMLDRIETAYRVLSTPEKRREYDRNYSSVGSAFVPMRVDPHPVAKVISIDRVPPMETHSSEEDPLSAPATDFPNDDAPSPERFVPDAVASSVTSTKNAFDHDELSLPAFEPAKAAADPNEVSLAARIDQETEWTGRFLRTIRENRGISIEELAEFTKISKTYIIAIEEENYPKLPASVFLRGFLSQIAKKLKIPSDPLIHAYLSRYKGQKADS